MHPVAVRPGAVTLQPEPQHVFGDPTSGNFPRNALHGDHNCRCMNCFYMTAKHTPGNASPANEIAETRAAVLVSVWIGRDAVDRFKNVVRSPAAVCLRLCLYGVVAF